MGMPDMCTQDNTRSYSRKDMYTLDNMNTYTLDSMHTYTLGNTKSSYSSDHTRDNIRSHDIRRVDMAYSQLPLLPAVLIPELSIKV